MGGLWPWMCGGDGWIMAHLLRIVDWDHCHPPLMLPALATARCRSAFDPLTCPGGRTHQICFLLPLFWREIAPLLSAEIQHNSRRLHLLLQHRSLACRHSLVLHVPTRCITSLPPGRHRSLPPVPEMKIGVAASAWSSACCRCLRRVGVADFADLGKIEHRNWCFCGPL
ncbi:hypothetical protein ACLOJK_041324 [Asimina triloba]